MKRFLLNWLTCLPGLAIGVYVIFRGKISALGWTAIVLAAAFLVRWFSQARLELDPEKIQQIATEILRSGPGVQPGKFGGKMEHSQ